MEKSFIEIVLMVALVTVVALSTFLLPFAPAVWRKLKGWFVNRLADWLFKGTAFFFVLVGVAHSGDYLYDTYGHNFHQRHSYALRQLQNSYKLLNPNPQLNFTITIPETKVTIVGDRKSFEWKWAQQPENNVIGYTNLWPVQYPDGRRTSLQHIYILGTEVEGKIIFNTETLGHEFLHVLHHHRPSLFLNPDH